MIFQIKDWNQTVQLICDRENNIPRNFYSNNLSLEELTRVFSTTNMLGMYKLTDTSQLINTEDYTVNIT